MTAARDELWDLIESTIDDVNIVYDALTEAIYSAGYRKPRVIATAEELDKLPAWSIVEADGVCFVKSLEGNVCWESMSRSFACSSIRLMEAHFGATVLFTPEQTA